MAYFPFFADIKNQTCVIVGGDVAASHYADALVSCGARVVVIAPRVCIGISRNDALEVKPRNITPTDIDGAFLVVAALEDAVANQHIAIRCKTRGVPVFVPDSPADSTFLFPELAKRGDMTVGVCSGGKSQFAAEKLRWAIEDIMPDCLGEILNWLDSLRPILEAELADPAQRSNIAAVLLAAGIKHGKPLPDEKVSEQIAKWKNNANA